MDLFFYFFFLRIVSKKMNSKFALELVQTRKNADMLITQNDKLKEKILANQRQFNKIMDIQKSMETVSNSLNTSDSELYDSAAETLSYYKFSPSLYEESTIKENEGSSPQYQLLMHMLKTFTDLAERSSGSKIALGDLWQCEKEIRERIYYAEEELIIPPILESEGWKKKFNDHESNL